MIELIGTIGIGLLLGLLATSMYMNPPGSRGPSIQEQDATRRRYETERRQRETLERDRAMGVYVQMGMDELVVLDSVFGPDRPTESLAIARRSAMDRLREAGLHSRLSPALEERLRAVANQGKP